MKAKWFMSLTAVICAVLMLLTGCGEVSPDTPTGTTTATTTGDTAKFPTVTGTYNDQTITMRYVTRTTLDWDADWAPAEFANGYAVVQNSGKFTVIDRTGKVMFAPVGGYIHLFGAYPDGRLLAERSQDGTYVWLDLTGKELAPSDEFVAPDTSTTKREPLAEDDLPENGMGGWLYDDKVMVVSFGDQNSGPFGEYQQLLSKDGRPLCEEKFSRIGMFDRGLALCVKDGKLGIIDEDGHMVIDPTYEIPCPGPADGFSMNEGLFQFEDEGKIGLIEISHE